MTTRRSSTRKQAHRVAGNALQAAMERGLTVRNPFKVIKRTRGASTPAAAPLSVGELKALRTYIAGGPTSPGG